MAGDVVALGWTDLKPKTQMCLFCGGLSVGRSSCRTEDFVSFGCCEFANDFCAVAGVWAGGRSTMDHPHGHELPEYWPLHSPSDIYDRQQELVAQHFARHEAEGTAAPFLRETECE